MKRKIIPAIIAVIMFFSLNYSLATSSIREEAEKNTKKVDSSVKVVDDAELLSAEEENNLTNQIYQFIENYNMDMVIVTININNKNSAMDYADDFYDYNNYGIGSNKSGILFLIDMDNREMWISTTGTAISIYTDSRINTILDYTYNEIKAEKYYQCCTEFISRATYYADYQSFNEAITTISNSKKVSKKASKNEVLQMLIKSGVLSVILTIVFIIVGCKMHKTAKVKKEANSYRFNFALNGRQDQFIHRNRTSRYIGSDNNSRGGFSSSSSSGGGSSIHTSSSGTTHGGGGRSF